MRSGCSPDAGCVIFGARTVSSNSDWRYVNVRRLLMMIEKAIGLSCHIGRVRAQQRFHPIEAASRPDELPAGAVGSAAH